jgi:hypothetical protein
VTNTGLSEIKYVDEEEEEDAEGEEEEEAEGEEEAEEEEVAEGEEDAEEEEEEDAEEEEEDAEEEEAVLEEFPHKGKVYYKNSSNTLYKLTDDGDPVAVGRYDPVTQRVSKL